MSFLSLEFYIFFLVSFLVYFALPQRMRCFFLLGASYFFYMKWRVGYIFVLLFCTMITYSTAILMDRFSGKREKKILLLISVISNFGLLCFYKYLNFANESLETLLSYFRLPYHIPHLEILLPLGISFFTFQAVSYSLDVYRGDQRPERHFGVFSLYLAFFPKLISGPIERASHLLPQLKRKADFDLERIFSGLRLLLWGIFKKMVIADRLGIYVNMVFNHPQDFSGQTLILAAWFYTLQIYCDFSGYTDMAIGCGRVFGIELTQNFNFPYFARNIADFWRRWHMTLTSWFRDYLYIPLGGNRCRPSRWRMNILTVFVICGLWHGANWTFVLWGALHGFYYLCGRATIRIRTQYWTSIRAGGGLFSLWQVFVTFNLVSLAWILFRSNSIQDALYIFSHLFVDIATPVYLGPSRFGTIITVLLLISFIFMESMLYLFNKGYFRAVSTIPFAMKCPIYSILLVSIFLFGVSSNEFIYFHF